MIAWNPVRSIARTGRRLRDRRIRLAALMVTAAVLLGGGVARAQGAGAARPPGSPWWAGGGGGFLAGRADCTNCEHDRPYGNGGALLLQGGVRVHERVLVGGELFSTGRTSEDVNVRHTYLLALAQFSPLATHGFFVKGGYGLAVIREAFAVDGVDSTVRTRGMGLMYGAGWVFGQGRRVSIAPVAAQYVTTIGDVQTGAGAAQNVVVNGWFVGAVMMVR